MPASAQNDLPDQDPHILNHAELLRAVVAAQRDDTVARDRLVTDEVRALESIEHATLWELAARGWERHGRAEQAREAITLANKHARDTPPTD